MKYIEYIFLKLSKLSLFILEKIYYYLKKIFTIIIFPFDFLLKKIIFPFFILNIYKILLYIKNIYGKSSKEIAQWIFAPFTSKYTIYIIILIISFNLLVNNLYAKEINADITPVEGQNGILLSLITPENSSLIEEHASFAHLDYNLNIGNNEDEYLNLDNLDTDITFDYMREIAESTLDKPNVLYTKSNLKLRDSIEEYIVESGDTLSTIAEKFGLKLSTILDVNNLSLRSKIKPGQKLKILPVDGFLYNVKSGDSINKLAKKFQAQDKQIIAYNKLENTTLSKGQELIIPFGVKPKPKPVIAKQPSYSASSSSTNSSHNYYTEYYGQDYAPLSDTKLQWPCSEHIITQYYHYGHPGLDISGPARLKAKLYAAEDGVVIKAQGGWNGGYGTYVIIDHGNGIKTLYGHASRLYVKVGDHVKRGQVIANMGSTGRSTGPHIHFEVRVNNKKVNPLNYIR